MPLQYYANPASIEQKSANIEKHGQYEKVGQYGKWRHNFGSDAHSAQVNTRSEFVNGNSFGKYVVNPWYNLVLYYSIIGCYLLAIERQQEAHGP